MWLPGLMRCGSTIQPARLPRRVRQRAGRERAAARDVGQVGRGRVRRPACRAIAWHITQGPRSKTSVPALLLGRGGRRRRRAVARPASARSRRAARRPRGAPSARAAGRRTRRTGRGRRPAGRPAARARSTGPGIRSILPCRFGTQKLWITSVESRSNATGRPTGMWISLAVVTRSERDRVAVLHLPPPLAAGHLDAQRVGATAACRARGRSRRSANEQTRSAATRR